MDDKEERQLVQEYLALPNRCPICKSRDVEGDSLDADGKNAWQNVECLACGATWHDTYTLTGMEIESYPSYDIAYKVVRATDGVLRSVTIDDDTARCVYTTTVWTHASAYMAERGYHPTVFETLEQALEFRLEITLDYEFQVWEVMCRIPVDLPPRCVTYNLSQLRTSSAAWPEGTRMYQGVKLLRRLV